MKKLFWTCVAAFLLAGSLASLRTWAAAPKPNEDVLLSAMQKELARAQTELGKQDPAPYFLAYSVHDQSEAVAVATQSELIFSNRSRQRTGDVIMRVGTPALDNSHQENRSSAIDSAKLPLDDDADSIAHSLWSLTYAEYRNASKAYLNVKTKTQVDTTEEDTSADFSQEAPQLHTQTSPSAAPPDQHLLEDMVRKDSALLRKYPYLYHTMVFVTADQSRRHFVSTEGTRLVTDGASVRLVIIAQTLADDGMELMRYETAQADSVEHLPSQAEMTGRIEKMASDLRDLRAAPVAEPFNGPALLSGHAAAVFFHEVLGHRLEGQRQRGETEGQTFTKKVGQSILPAFLNVIDDPTQHVLNGMDMSGAYDYDDEGVPAARVELVSDGILKNFLMSRMPIKNFSKSNGHGRGEPGSLPVARQGNLIVSSSRTVKDAELRQKLIDEIKKQGKPYGLYFEDVQGGFTLTQRFLPQAFQVLPIMVWRVYPDGRPDELVRGIDVVGTPLEALDHIILTGEKVDVFNGVCGAESGSVPVSAAAPAMLLSAIEVQKRAHGLDRVPILPPPGFDPPAFAGATKAGGQQ